MAKKKNLEWRNCSEEELRSLLAKFAGETDFANAIVFLNGKMGAGKSTFARALLEVLAPGQLSKGSPTFPLVQEYRRPNGAAIYHIDLYRLKSAGELHESGIDAQIEEPGALALVEWADQFPEHFEYWSGPAPAGRKRAKNVWTVEISEGDAPNQRTFKLSDNS